MRKIKRRFPGEKERAMGHAIANTFKSVMASSVTTIAGFAALCFMTFALGRDLGIVMGKGVIMGVICCVTVLPALILTFDRGIEKTSHKLLIPSMDHFSQDLSQSITKRGSCCFYCCSLRRFTETAILISIIILHSHCRHPFPAMLPMKKLSEDFDMANYASDSYG